MDMPLSLRTTRNCRLRVPALLSPSSATPLTIEASPTRETTFGRGLPGARTAGELVAAGHAHGGGDAGAGVADGEEVVLGFTGSGKPDMPSRCAQLLEQPQPAGQQLVGVALVADVEQQPVVG